MAIDNTHTKYLHGSDKKAWNNYKESYEAQQKLDKFMEGFKFPKKLKKGEEFDIPMKKNPKNKNKNNK